MRGGRQRGRTAPTQPDSGTGRGKLTSTLMNLITNMDFLFLKLCVFLN